MASPNRPSRRRRNNRQKVFDWPQQLYLKYAQYEKRFNCSCIAAYKDS